MQIPRCPALSYGAFRRLRNATIAFLTVVFAFGQAALSETLTLVALGDSLTAGYGLPPEQGFAPVLNGWLVAHGLDVSVANAGVSGDTTAGGLARLDWSLTPDTDALIVNLGGNDLLRGLDPSQAKANLDKIIATAQSRNLPVLLVGLKALNNYGPDYKSAFDAIYPALATQYGTLLIEDYFAPLKTSDAELAAHLQPDGIHPNAAGVVKIVEAMGPQVLKLLDEVGK